MPVYEKVPFEMNGIARGILCKGPQGSSGLVAVYNIAVINFTQVYGAKGPLDEEEVKLVIRQMLQEVSKIMGCSIEYTLPTNCLSVIDEHQVRLVVCPILGSALEFEISDSYLLFPVLGINLLHGWVVDPEESIYASIKGYSRDQLSAYHASLECQEDQTDNWALVQRLLDAADHQLTDYGFKSLFAEIEEEAFAVIFCYNRFNVVQKHEGELFILETDEGVRHRFPDVVWRLFDGEVPEDSIYLTGKYIPVVGQPNIAKVTKWTQKKSRKESDETSSQKETKITSEKQSKGQKRKAQRKKSKEKAIASSESASDAGQKSEGKVEPAAETKQSEASAENVDGVPASESEMSTGDVTKDDSKKEEGQGAEKKKNKPENPNSKTLSGSAQRKLKRQNPKNEDSSGDGSKKNADKEQELSQEEKNMTPEEYEKMLGKKMSLEPSKPEERKIAPPCENFQNQGIDYVPAASAASSQGQPTVVSDFLDFLLGFEHDGCSKYFEGIVEAFKKAHAPWFFVPYEFIMEYNEILALKIQDDYPRIYKDLKESVVQYLKIHELDYSNVELKIFGLPEPKSVQTFEDFVGSIVLLEVYDVYGTGLDELPSYDGRRMALGYLRNIVEKFRTGKCWGGKWTAANMRVKNSGSEFVIDCELDEDLTSDSAFLDLRNFSETVLQRFTSANGQLPSYFEEFDEDCMHIPDHLKDPVKWERFLKLISSPFALKPPLVRSAFICNAYLAANSNCSGNPPRYDPLFSRKNCTDWRPAARKNVLLKKVYEHQSGHQTFKFRYHLDRWSITHWSLLKYARHFIQHVLRHTKGQDLVQQIQDIAVVDILLSRKVGKFVAQSVRFLILECGVDDLFSSAWRHFVASECTDKPQGNIGLKDATTIEELLCSVSDEEMVAVAYAEVGIPPEMLHKSTVISDADLTKFSSLLNENGLKCQVTEGGHLQIQCQFTQDGDLQSIKVFKHSPQERTSGHSVIAVEGPYCEEYNSVFELLGVWLGL